jgi:hypothetical protein
VAGSRRYRSFEERLISAGTVRELQQAGTWPIAVEAEFERFIASRRTRLDERLKEVDACAAAGSLPEMTVTNGLPPLSRTVLRG